MSVSRDGRTRSGLPPVVLAVPAGPWTVVFVVAGTIAAVIALWFLAGTASEAEVVGEMVAANQLSKFGIVVDPKKNSGNLFVILNVPQKYDGMEIRRWRISVEIVDPISGDISRVPTRWFESGALVDVGRAGSRNSGNVLARYVSFLVCDDSLGNPSHRPVPEDGNLVMVRVQRTRSFIF